MNSPPLRLREVKNGADCRVFTDGIRDVPEHVIGAYGAAFNLNSLRHRLVAV
jgi:hypothetical protein